MPQWVQVVLTGIYLVWLFAVLCILWLVWRKQVQRLAMMELSLIQDSRVSAQAAEKAAEAAFLLATHLQAKIAEGETFSG